MFFFALFLRILKIAALLCAHKMRPRRGRRLGLGNVLGGVCMYRRQKTKILTNRSKVAVFFSKVGIICIADVFFLLAQCIASCTYNEVLYVIFYAIRYYV